MVVRYQMVKLPSCYNYSRTDADEAGWVEELSHRTTQQVRH